MRLPFILFGQHTVYTYRVMEELLKRWILPQLVVVSLPARDPKKVREPLRYFQFSRGERYVPSLSRGPYDLSPLVIEFGCDMLETHEVNNPAVWAHLAGQRPSFFLTAGFHTLFSPNLLALAPRAALNLHPSLLPLLRGPTPFFWIWKKELYKAAGVTLHHMNERADRGAIISQAPLTITKNMNIFDYIASCGRLGGQLFAKMIESGDIPAGTPQPPERTFWARRPTLADRAINPLELTMDGLERLLAGLNEAYPLHVSLGVDDYYLKRLLEKRPDMQLAGQYLLKGDTLYLPVKDGLAVLEINGEVAP